MDTHSDTQTQQKQGILYALACYGTWGLFPLFWYPLNHSAMPADQILAQRIVWSGVFAAALLLAFKQGRLLLNALRQVRLLAVFALSSFLIAANWLVYVWAITNNHILEASLGYFINPLFNVFLGALMFQERPTRLQTAAVALAFLGILWLAVPGGKMPWISLALAASFGFYGAVRKIAPMPPLAGLTLETLLLLPFALGYLAWRGAQGTLVFAELDALQKTVLFASGAATTLPLLAFAAAAKRIALSLLGILQNISPSAQLLIGLALGEHLDAGRLAGYGLVWAGVAVFLFGVWRQMKRHGRTG
nr:EamA family transporter RarD [uncultured Kingella sp.]